MDANKPADQRPIYNTMTVTRLAPVNVGLPHRMSRSYIGPQTGQQMIRQAMTLLQCQHLLVWFQKA